MVHNVFLRLMTWKIKDIEKSVMLTITEGIKPEGFSFLCHSAKHFRDDTFKYSF